MKKHRQRPLHWVVFAALFPFAACAESERKHACAVDEDCLTGRVCRLGVCEAPNPCDGPCGQAGSQENGGASGAAGEAVAGSQASDGGVSGALSHAGAGEEASGKAGNQTVSGGAGSSSPSSGESGGGGDAAGDGGGGIGSGNSGKGGTSAGDSGTAGGGAGSGSGGSSGSGAGGSDAGSGNGGTAGDGPLCNPDDYQPFVACESEPWGSFPALGMSAATGVALLGAVNEIGSGFVLWASKAGTDTVGVTWTDGVSPWVNFGCFDTVPAPGRAAAAKLRNTSSEVYVIGHCGTLYMRNMLFEPYALWQPWVRLPLPNLTSAATDVAASLAPDGTNVLYVAHGGIAYVASRSGPDPYAAFGPWHALAVPGLTTTLIAAGRRNDLRQQAFTIDAEGRPWSNIQSTKDPDSPFEGWQDFGSSEVLALIDIEVVYGKATLEILALDADHELWSRVQNGDGSFSPWEEWAYGEPEIPFKTISASSFSRDGHEGTALAGAGELGVFVRERWDGVWDFEWHLFDAPAGGG